MGWFVVAALATATAGSVDTYGFGAQSIGRGQGGVAVPDGSLTVMRNPALLQNLDTAQAVIGYGLYRSKFKRVPSLYWDTSRDGRITREDNPLSVQPDASDADAVTLAIGRHVGKRFALAANGLVPTDRLLRLRTVEPAMPSYVMYGNRSQRYELAAGFGLEAYKGISVGAAAELVARARYRVNATIAAGMSGASDSDENAGDLVDTVELDIHDMTLDLVPAFVPVVGVYWDVGKLLPVLDGLAVGAVYRGASGLPIDVDIDVQVNAEVSSLGDLDPLYLSLAMPIQLEIFDHYVPERWSWGLAYRYKQIARAYLDVHHYNWSRMRLNVVQVTQAEVQSELLQLGNGTVSDGNTYTVEFGNTTEVHTGIEGWMPKILVKGPAEYVLFTLRTGFGYAPSPLVRQGASTNFLDGDRVLFAGGFGVSHLDPFELVSGVVSWDFFFTHHTLASGKLKQEDAGPHRPGSPVNGQAIPIGGHLWSTGAQWSVDF